MGRIAYDKPEILVEHIYHHHRMADAYDKMAFEEQSPKKAKRLSSRRDYHARKAEQLREQYNELYPHHYSDL